MKITLVGPVYPYRGGIARFMTSLSQKLVAAGNDVQTVSFRRQYPVWLYPGQTDKDPSAPVEHLLAFYTLDPFYPWTWANTVRQITGFQPDLVIVQWWTTFWGPAFFFIANSLKRNGIACVFCIHNVIPHEKHLPDVWMSRGVLSQGKAHIILSPKESDHLQKLLPTAKIYHARLPVSKLQVPDLNRQEIRTELGIAEQQPVLLFFGIVRPYKGLMVLLDALALLKRENIRPFLIVAGEFWENEKKYLKKIDALALSDQIYRENRYVPDEDLWRFFTAADAFVAPYTSGTQSAAIKTAMSFGLPILASDQISSDLPLDSYPVHIHRAGDEENLAQSIRGFIDQNEMGKRFRLRAGGWGELTELAKKIAVELAGPTRR